MVIQHSFEIQLQFFDCDLHEIIRPEKLICLQVSSYVFLIISPKSDWSEKISKRKICLLVGCADVVQDVAMPDPYI
jgi:hypothetical protein